MAARMKQTPELSPLWAGLRVAELAGEDLQDLNRGGWILEVHRVASAHILDFEDPLA